jgi:CBS domain-containing protein
MELRAKDIIIKQRPIVLDPKDTLYDARNMMVRYNISRIVIVENEENTSSKIAKGVITEKDIARFLYEEAPNRRLNEIRLEEVMSKSLITAKEDDSVADCARLMLDNGISSVIVVTKVDRKTQRRRNTTVSDFMGVVTKSDLVEAYVMMEPKKEKVLTSEYMAEDVFTADEDEAIHIVLMLMANNKISRVVVIKNSRPIGIVTTHDLLPVSSLFGTGAYGRFWTTEEKEISKRREQKFIPSGIKNAFLVSDVMTKDPICISIHSKLTEAAHIMTRNKISGLPVIESNEDLAGIITKTDIVRSIAGFKK